MILSLRLIGLCACLAFASAHPALFPREKVTTYKYYAEVQTMPFFGSPFTSQFVIFGRMHVTPEISDPNLKNALYVYFDVTHGIQNGKIDESEKMLEDRLQPIPDAAKALKDPFVIVFDDNGMVKDLMVNKNEPEWSRNMKRAFASTGQLDLSSMNLVMPMEMQAFNKTENTVYGACDVRYYVNSKPDEGEKMFEIVKSMDPMTCMKFDQYTFNSEEPMDCFVEKEVETGAFIEKTFHIEHNGADLLIKKFTSYGVMNYSPWKDASDIHNIFTNQTGVFESSSPVGDVTLPTLNMEEMVSLTDLTFQKPKSKFADSAAADFTYGRHAVNSEVLITGLVEMLGEAADYMNETHMEKTEHDMVHGQTISRILDAMSLMDFSSLEDVVVRITGGTSHKEVTIRKIFLQMLPYVGTDATLLFTMFMISDEKVPDMMAVDTVAKLPFYVREPTEELLGGMEGLMDLGDDVPRGVKRAGILAFATLLHKAHRYEKYHHPLNPETVSRYVNDYFGHVMNETSYDMKVLYIQAMKNMGIGDVYKLLKPIVSGEMVLSEKPHHLRVMAMHVYDRARPSDVNIDELFWPILEDKESPMEIRATALTILFHQPPTSERFMRLLVLMEHEKNEHLYNYYYTTMESFANSSSSCLKPLKEMARNVLLDIRVRRPAEHLRTGVKCMDYENEEFGFGESWTGNYIADEHTGIPFCSSFEYSANDWQSPVNHFTVFLRVEGFDDVVGTMPWDMSLEDLDVPIEKIENLLKKASEDMPGRKPAHVELAVMHQGRIVYSKYFDEKSLPESVGSALVMFFVDFVRDMTIWQDIMFAKLFTKLVINDLGLPTVFEVKKPHMITAQKHMSHMVDTLQIELSAKSWSHGYESMEVYNPMADTWHAVRRVSAVDSSLPFAMSIKFPDEIKGFTVTLPRLPKTEHSVSYSRIYNKDYVMVIGLEKDVFDLYCPNCNSTQVLTSDSETDEVRHLMNIDSPITGIKTTAEQYGCDREYLSITGASVFDKFVDNPNVRSTKDLITLGLMTIREYQRYLCTTSSIGKCGYLVVSEPSVNYPVSEVDINVFMDKSTSASENVILPPAMEIDFNVSLVAKPVSTESRPRSITVTGTWNSTEGYYENDLQIDVTGRSAVVDDYLKACIDVHKSYPRGMIDPFDRTVDPNRKTTGTLRLLVGSNEINACPTEGLRFVMEMEGKMSDEQKEALEHGKIHDACQKDVENPLYMHAESSLTPRTSACMHEALLRTTLREYVAVMSFQNVPDQFAERMSEISEFVNTFVETNFTTLPEHTEPGSAKLLVKFPLDTQSVNINLRTPVHEMVFTDVLMDEGEGWDDVLDNTHFSSDVLDNLRDRAIEYCVVYPEILTNTDGGTTPYTVPGQWTLVTGDYKSHAFSVFVKSIEPKKLALLISLTNNTIEVIPTDANPTVKVNGNPVTYENGFVVPQITDEDDVVDAPALRFMWSSDPKRFQITSKYLGLDLEWTERSVLLGISTTLRGEVTGLCGHLDGTHKEQMAKVYTLED